MNPAMNPGVHDVPTTKRCPCLDALFSCTCEVTVILRDPSLVPGQDSIKNSNWRVQRRATRWILKQRIGVMSYRDRLLTLKLLPLTFDRELKDLVFFYKCLNGFTDLNVSDFVSFVSHGRTRLSNSYSLKTPVCKTSTFQASYFNRIAKLCFYICKFSPPTSFSTTAPFRNFITEHMFHLLLNHFDIYYPCTWSFVRSCPCHP